ncbi:hypothetical protein BO83DRAFT_74506 [Aspergillus eucalypticola CBS 122712]|uniref:Uncharacterized protein n=1 Tax=Aspergillus eucalypticola (strain CBS 122712 / IBT 29274) TaxID=1448314 RepID=A0A317V3C4_ASPEC|nr:uncharacterized protein BO83DRAFT_74506 [Aspergillus eucalypticola CBS 122712]PWY68763.1 hypothetical protein BO83DRAFT_74506 [Aspergillus eucalypticola CBS 122712]
MAASLLVNGIGIRIGKRSNRTLNRHFPKNILASYITKNTWSKVPTRYTEVVSVTFPRRQSAVLCPMQAKPGGCKPVASCTVDSCATVVRSVQKFRSRKCREASRLLANYWWAEVVLVLVKDLILGEGEKSTQYNVLSVRVSFRKTNCIKGFGNLYTREVYV